MILSRGGGSLEDLWCFNEEPVVRAVANSTLPTVSAVGHEIDVTLCDLAADVRALTPTDAATRVLPDGESLSDSVQGLRRRIDRAVSHALSDRRRRLDSIASRPIIRNPMEIVHVRSQRLDELDDRARRAVRSHWRLGATRLQSLSASLAALSPLNVLARGYSFTLDADGNTVKDAANVRAGDILRTRVASGEIESEVRKTSV